MAITVNLDNLVNSLMGAGYKNIGQNYKALQAKGVKLTATFNKIMATMPNGDGYETDLPSSPTVISNSVHNKVLVTPFVLTLNSFFGAMVDLASGNKISDPTIEMEHKSSNVPFYANSKEAEQVKTSDPAEAVALAMEQSLVKKPDGSVGIIGSMIKQGLSEAIDATLPPKEKTQSIAQQKLFVDCGHIVCGKFDENMVKLYQAEELLEAVYGSSTTSTYYCIGLCEYEGCPINIGIRVVSHDEVNYTVSLRFEWKGTLTDTKLKNALESNGYTVKEDYASIHFTVAKVDTVRAVTAMVYCMPITYRQTAQIKLLG